MFDAVLAGMSATDQATIQALNGGETETDTTVCAAERANSATALGLGTKNLAALALADVTP
jgi:hypothetical protein